MPNTKAERVVIIDMLRGAALFGILLIHVATFARPGAPPGISYVGSTLNELILAGLILLIEGKFFSLFSMLFGVSFAIQYESATKRNKPFVPQFRRRLFILALIGLAHIVLLWEGDILLLYALVGFTLIPLRERPPDRLLRWVVALLAIPLLIISLAFVGLLLARMIPAAEIRVEQAEVDFNRDFADSRQAIVARYESDELLANAQGRVMAYIGNLPLLLIRGSTVLALFLLGFVVGRQKILHDPDAHLPLIRRVRTWGLGVGLAVSLCVTMTYLLAPPFTALTALGFNQVFGGPVLALGYGAAFALLARRPDWDRRLAPLASYGRMALTIYLLQSAICGLLFYGFGFGLVWEVAPYQSLIIALLLNVALIAGSDLWLRRFRYGPVEWLWRSLTLGKRQPFLRATTTQPPHTEAESGATDAPRRDTPFDEPQTSERH